MPIMIRYDPATQLHCEHQLSVVLTLADILVSDLDGQQLPAALLAALSRAWPSVGAVVLLLVDTGTGRYRPAAAQGSDWTTVRDLDLGPAEAFLGKPPTQGAHWVAVPGAAGETATGLSPTLLAAMRAAFGQWIAPQALVVVPLTIGERAIGVLWLLVARDDNALTEADAPFLQRLGSQIALAVDRAQSPAWAHVVEASSDQVRSEVMATLSHEMRTPLAAIKGYATALLLEEVAWPPEEQRELLTHIDQECDTLQAMLGEVLDSALIDAGHLSIDREPLRLPNVIKEIAEETQYQTSLHRLVVDLPADIPLVLADPRRMRQVLRNLMDNAVKYSPAGGLIVVQCDVRPNAIVVSIADQGVGIAPEDLIPLFDKYFRVKGRAGGHIPGTGLGLPITRALVEAHGGRIWAESKVGQGTTFLFSLPRADLEQAGPE